MVLGLGSDIIAVKRIESSILRYGKRFLDRLFTVQEQAYCQAHRDAARHYAGRFAAKEAIAKALGTGIGVLAWDDIEILNDAHGKPIVQLSLTARETFHDPIIQVSISHCKEYALAVALWIQ